MLNKLAIATVVVIASVSGSMAATSKVPTSKVYVNGKYVGADPDPTIRSQLAHDPTQGS